MRSGKLSPDLLARLIGSIRITDPRVRLGPRLGEDAGVVEIAGDALIVSTDPITFVSSRAAWYAVQVNANDVAACGADPAWLAATLLLPPETAETDLADLFAQLGKACGELRVTLVTGHTEITPAVNRPIVVGTMLGLTAAGDAVASGGALPGDTIVLAGPIAVEGTAILAAEAADALQAARVQPEIVATAAGFLEHPGISVVRAARIVRAITRPHAMHDATEGGIATALREVAEASGAGLTVNFEALPLMPQTEAICAALGLDPLGLISSGCLIAVVNAEDAGRLVEALQDANLKAAAVGTITEDTSLQLRRGQGIGPLPAFDRDELARYFATIA